MEMPTVVAANKYEYAKKISWSAELSMKKFYNLGAKIRFIRVAKLLNNSIISSN